MNSADRSKLIMLHGLGGNKQTLEPVAKRLCKRVPLLDVELLQGPMPHGKSYLNMFGWFVPPNDDGRDFEQEGGPVFEGIDLALRVVNERISAAIEDGYAPERVFLYGHSQGGAMALTAGILHDARLGGIATIAGYLALRQDMQPTQHDVPIWLHHATADDNVSYRWATYALERLQSWSYPVSLSTYELDYQPHLIRREQVEAIGEELAGVLMPVDEAH